MKLYTYRRSQASFRLRIAVNLKGITREDGFLHLEKGDQFAAAYRAFNPQMVVPTLSDGNSKLFQFSNPDEKYPEPLPHHDCEDDLQELRCSNVYEFVANSPTSTRAVPTLMRPMLRGTPAFPLRCKVRLSPITRKPARVKTFMPKKMSLVSTEIYSSGQIGSPRCTTEYRRTLLA